MKLTRLLLLGLSAPLLGSCWLLFPPEPYPQGISLDYSLPELPTEARNSAYLSLFWYDAQANPQLVFTTQVQDRAQVQGQANSGQAALKPTTSPPPPPNYGTGRTVFLSGYTLRDLPKDPRFLLTLEAGEARDKTPSALTGADGVRTGTLYPFIWRDVNGNRTYDFPSDPVLFDTNDVISYANKAFSYSLEGNYNGVNFREKGSRRAGWTHVKHYVISGAFGNEVTWDSLPENSPSLYRIRFKETTNLGGSMSLPTAPGGAQ